MRVLIAGCGDVGNVLAGRLLQSGHTVFGLKRNTSTLPQGVHAISADLTRPASLYGLPSDLDQVVFMPTPAERSLDAYSEIFVQGWKHLWQALPEPPARTLMVSSTAVYGQNDGSWVDERTQARPAKFNGQVLLQMEDLARSSGTTTVIARLSGIYGPGRDRLIRQAASDGVPAGAGNVITNRVHIEDAGAALAHLLSLKQAQELYLVSDDMPVAKCEVVTWLADQLGRPVQAYHPLSGTDTDIGTGADIGTGSGEDSGIREGRGLGEVTGKRISNQRLCDSGFEFQYPDYRVGYGAILEQRYQHEFSG